MTATARAFLHSELERRSGMPLYSVTFECLVLIFGLAPLWPTSFADYPSSGMLCPQGYWASRVNTSGGPYGTDRTYELLYGPTTNEPICRFCPDVGCFIVKTEKRIIKPWYSSPQSTTRKTPGQTRVRTLIQNTTNREEGRKTGLPTDEAGGEQGTGLASGEKKDIHSEAKINNEEVQEEEKEISTTPSFRETEWESQEWEEEEELDEEEYNEDWSEEEEDGQVAESENDEKVDDQEDRLEEDSGDSDEGTNLYTSKSEKRSDDQTATLPPSIQDAVNASLNLLPSTTEAGLINFRKYRRRSRRRRRLVRKIVNIYMSCGPLNRLPPPADIVSYLDCVQIGMPKAYYLFISKPRFQDEPLPPVDCVDTNFLTWISNGTQLLGLELGFPMKSIPPFLFLYHQRIMKSTQHICIDASALTNNSVASLDMKRFASDQFSQVVFRRSGLSRERAPPKAPQEHYWRPYQSEESVLSCPPFSSDSPAPLTEEGDCQYSPTVIPTTSDLVKAVEAEGRCEYRLPQVEAKKPVRRKRGHTFLGEKTSIFGALIKGEENAYITALLSFGLLVLVSLLTVGTIFAFCVKHRDKAAICSIRRKSKRSFPTVTATGDRSTGSGTTGSGLNLIDHESSLMLTDNQRPGDSHSILAATRNSEIGLKAATAASFVAGQLKAREKLASVGRPWSHVAAEPKQQQALQQLASPQQQLQLHQQQQQQLQLHQQQQQQQLQLQLQQQQHPLQLQQAMMLQHGMSPCGQFGPGQLGPYQQQQQQLAGMGMQPVTQMNSNLNPWMMMMMMNNNAGGNVAMPGGQAGLMQPGVPPGMMLNYGMPGGMMPSGGQGVNNNNNMMMMMNMLPMTMQQGLNLQQMGLNNNNTGMNSQLQQQQQAAMMFNLYPGASLPMNKQSGNLMYPMGMNNSFQY